MYMPRMKQLIAGEKKSWRKKKLEKKECCGIACGVVFIKFYFILLKLSL